MTQLHKKILSPKHLAQNPQFSRPIVKFNTNAKPDNLPRDVNSQSNRNKLRLHCTMADNRARCGHECITNRIIMLWTLIRHDLLHTCAISCPLCTGINSLDKNRIR